MAPQGAGALRYPDPLFVITWLTAHSVNAVEMASPARWRSWQFRTWTASLKLPRSPPHRMAPLAAIDSSRVDIGTVTALVSLLLLWSCASTS